ncbi:MAG: M48 family metallopeptidase [Candidatus Limnocylindrales bacterium]
MQGHETVRGSGSASVTVATRQTPPWLRTLALAFAALIVSMAFVLLVVVVIAIIGWIILGAANALPDPDRRWPRLSALALVAIPAVALLLAFLINRGSEGRTFYAQQSANRRVSLLLLVAMVGLVVALGEAIAASFTFDSYGALVGAGVAAVVGVGAAAFAHFSGPGAVLSSTKARRAVRAAPGIAGDETLLNVVDELSIAANMAPPAVYVINDGSLNAMAVGTKPSNAALAVTSGMLDRFDREELQGVIGHELAHIRNLDSRYGVYVAILVGLVALVTDGFLRMVLRAWAEGLFFKGADADDAKGAIAGLAAGVVFGIFLLLIAFLLRIFAPIASLLVQAATSRQREYLADATSVELTRNPTGLARALAALREDRDPLEFANRGSQHLWFSNPVGALSDGRTHWLSTHPTLDARIERLGDLYPQLSEMTVAIEPPKIV